MPAPDAAPRHSASDAVPIPQPIAPSIPAPIPGPIPVPIAPLTTLRLGGPAQRLIEPATADELVAVLAELDAAAAACGPAPLLLGGGSNVVVSDGGWPGPVVRIATTGHRREAAPDGRALLVAEAGQDWDDLVAAAVDDGLGGGLECLSGIPGRTGATPVQNVGAYGVEIADLLVDVDLYDRRTGTVHEHVPAAALELRYRTSTLKGRDDRVVLRVRLAVPGDGAGAPIRYPELARTLGVAVGDRVPAAAVRAAVLALRRGKGMVLDATDHDTWSAGSFFTNPVLPAAAAPPDAPRWPAGGEQVKVPAAWLIEQSGFARGHAGPGGRVALSGKHVLALTHRGGGRTADLLELAREVRDGVTARFGVVLAPEPVLVHCRVEPVA